MKNIKLVVSDMDGTLLNSKHEVSDNFSNLYNQLKNKGVKFEHEPIDQPCLREEAGLKDLDGNQLIFFYGSENRINPPWKIEN